MFKKLVADLLDYVDKPIMEWSWVPLLDISNLYNELIEWFHHHHPSLPKPSSHATKSKTQNLPLPAPHDPLSVPPHFITPPNPECSTYKPPSVATTQSNRKSKPCNLNHITDLVMLNDLVMLDKRGGGVMAPLNTASPPEFSLNVSTNSIH